MFTQEENIHLQCGEKWLCSSKQTEHTSCIKGCIDNSDEGLLAVGRQGVVVEAVQWLLLLVGLTGTEGRRGGSGRHGRQWSQTGRWGLLKRQRPPSGNEPIFREMHNGVVLKEKFRLFDDIHHRANVNKYEFHPNDWTIEIKIEFNHNNRRCISQERRLLPSQEQA